MWEIRLRTQDWQRLNVDWSVKRVKTLLQKLGCIDDDLSLIVCGVLRGGGGAPIGITGVTGPDLNSTKHSQHFEKNGRADRTLCYGVSIEWEYYDRKKKEKRNIIGHIKDNNGRTFDLSRGFNKAYCPALKQKCKTFDSIIKLWFSGCTVKFRWQTKDNNKTFTKTVHFKKKAYYYEGEKEYLWLEMDIKLNDDLDYDSYDDGEDEEEVDLDKDEDYEPPKRKKRKLN